MGDEGDEGVGPLALELGLPAPADGSQRRFAWQKRVGGFAVLSATLRDEGLEELGAR